MLPEGDQRSKLKDSARFFLSSSSKKVWTLNIVTEARGGRSDGRLRRRGAFVNRSGRDHSDNSWRFDSQHSLAVRVKARLCVIVAAVHQVVIVAEEGETQSTSRTVEMVPFQ